jgi:hypothetical protein
MKYVALLRGINVGGNTIIKMEQLRACFEAGGFSQIGRSTIYVYLDTSITLEMRSNELGNTSRVKSWYVPINT